LQLTDSILAVVVLEQLLARVLVDRDVEQKQREFTLGKLFAHDISINSQEDLLLLVGHQQS
jgi:hypothetical protein